MSWFLSPGWVGDPITWPNLPSQISKFPKLAHFCFQIQWAIQLYNPICHPKCPNCQNYMISVTQLSGWFNYPTQFVTWNLQIAKITWLLSPSWLGYQNTWPNLPPKMAKFAKLPDFCQSIESVIQLAYPICHLKSPIGQMTKITWFLWPDWVGNPITHPNLPSEMSKLPILADFCHLVEWAI